MTKLEQLADLRKKRKQAIRKWVIDLNNIQCSFIKNPYAEEAKDYDAQIKTLRRKIGPGDY